MPRALAFTGSRPDKLGGYDENNATAIKVKAKLRVLILQAIARGFERFWTGMAQGIDTWAAEIIIDLIDEGADIQLLASVPFLTQPRAWEKNQPAIERWMRILSRASEIYVVCPELETMDYDTIIAKLVDEPQTRLASWQVSAWMQTRNEHMVNNSDTVLAIWDGTSGGTANCVRYAKKRGNPIVIYNPATDTTRSEK